MATKDQYALNLTIEANANLIIRRDRGQLDLMVADDPPSQEYRRDYLNLKIIDPVGFLNQIVEPGSSEESSSLPWGPAV